jgi:hypothetical protein
VTIRGPEGARETHAVTLPADDDRVSSLLAVARLILVAVARLTLVAVARLATTMSWCMSRLPKGLRADLQNE